MQMRMGKAVIGINGVGVVIQPGEDVLLQARFGPYCCHQEILAFELLDRLHRVHRPVEYPCPCDGYVDDEHAMHPVGLRATRDTVECQRSQLKRCAGVSFTAAEVCDHLPGSFVQLANDLGL
ncbi:hypothetical protein D3C80_1247740 [compost metagenome]